MKPARILAIGGSDSSGGAGIEADIKTITALGGYALTAITAVTAQDTHSIRAITPVPPDLVALAITMVADDLGLDAIKVGMLGSAGTIAAIFEALRPHPAIPLVLDPVLASTSGTHLLDPAALDDLRRHLMPRATLITPNRDEAARLTGRAIETHADAIAAGRHLCAMGARAVLLKGGHFPGDELVDHLITEGTVIPFRHPRIDSRHTHGTGCTLASAIAVGLGNRLALDTAVERGLHYLQHALRNAPAFGSGHGPLGHATPLA